MVGTKPIVFESQYRSEKQKKTVRSRFEVGFSSRHRLCCCSRRRCHHSSCLLFRPGFCAWLEFCSLERRPQAKPQIIKPGTCQSGCIKS